MTAGISDITLDANVTNINNKAAECSQAQNVEDGFKIVMRRNRKQQRKVNVGSRTDIEESNFKSFKPNKESKKIWLFISRVNESVHVQDIREYISGRGNSEIDQISVMNLNTRSNQAGFKSYMVGVPLTMKEEVYKNDFWPVGVSFARFNFMRGQHFLEAQPNLKSST